MAEPPVVPVLLDSLQRHDQVVKVVQPRRLEVGDEVQIIEAARMVEFALRSGGVFIAALRSSEKPDI
jgi:hypothetical protein